MQEFALNARKRSLLLRCVLPVVIASTMSAQRNTPADQIPDLLPLPAGSAERQKREVRGKLFNNRSAGDSPRLDEQTKNSEIVTFVHGVAKPELPYDQSDTAVLGTVENVQPHLSDDKRVLYSEYTVVINEPIKVATNLTKQSRIAILRIGGVARAPNGQIIRHTVKGRGDDLQAGQEYLLFLRYNASADAFLLFKQWRVENGLLKAASIDDQLRASKGSSKVNGMALSDVLRAGFKGLE